MNIGISKIKVCLVDDHVLLRDSLAHALNSFDELEVVQVADNGREFITKLPHHPKPDIVLLDLNMPEMDGHKTTHWLSVNHPEIRILILTMYDSESLIHLIKKGVRGFLKKDVRPSELKTAIHSIMTDGTYCSQTVTGRLFNLMKSHGTKNSAWGNIVLNDTELSFLKYVTSELTYKEIALQMGISPRTVDNYRDALFLKLNVKSRVGLAMYAVKSGIVTMQN